MAIEEIEISWDSKFLEAHHVPEDAPLTLLEQFNCSYICYHLAPNITTSHNVFTSRIVSDVLMEHSRQSILPARLTNPILRADQQVQNELLNLLAEMSVGWSPSVVQSIGDRFIRILSATLWYLDSHHDSFLGQGIPIPKMFSKFQNYKAKKMKKPRLTKEGLNEHIQSLSAILCEPWFRRPLFSVLHNGVGKLVESLSLVSGHAQPESTSSNASPVPIRQPDDLVKCIRFYL